MPPELFTLVACLSGSQGTVELPEGPEHDATCSQQTPGPGSEPCRGKWAMGQAGAHAARRGAGPAACLHLDARKRGGGLKRNPRSGGSTPIVAEAKFSPPGLILPKSGVFSSLLNKADPPGWWLSRKETF